MLGGQLEESWSEQIIFSLAIILLCQALQLQVNFAPGNFIPLMGDLVIDTSQENKRPLGKEKDLLV